MKAVLLVSHGSHSPETKKEIQALLKRLQSKSGIKIFKFAFLEIASPNIPQGIEECVKEGAKEILILLNFLNSGKHVDRDIPAIIQEAKKRHPSVSIKMTHPIGQHTKIDEVFLEMINHGY